MTDKLSTDDLQGKVAQRDNDGSLIGDKHTLDWFGEEKEVRTKPITVGLLNEISDLDAAIQNLEPGAVHEAIQTIYLSESVLTLSEQDVEDMRSEALNKLLEPLEESVEEEFGDEPGNQTEPRKELA